MLRGLSKFRNVLFIPEARVFQNPLVTHRNPGFQCDVAAKSLSSMSISAVSLKLKDSMVGGTSQSNCGILLIESRRNYWGHEGRIGWRRRRRIEKEQREQILEPNTPLIDYKFPWPKDDTENLPPELFGEDVTVLSPEEEMQAQNQIVGVINKQIEENRQGRLFAVVHVAGKQFKVTPEDIIIVQEYFPPTTGDQIRLNKVLLVGGKDFTLIGRPLLDNDLVRVEATVIEKSLTATKLSFRMIKREQYRRLKFKQTLNTFLRINLIELMQPLDLIKPEFEAIENVNHRNS